MLPLVPLSLPAPRRLLSGMLAVLMMVGVLTGLAPSADAAAVPRSECARYDQGVRTGVCVRDPRGGLYWLGTLAGYDGREIYCIDYRFATSWGVKHQNALVSGTLMTSLGKTVGPAAVAALNYLTTRYPATAVNDTTAAAIELIIRQVMGDANTGGHGIPGGLTVGVAVRDVGFVPDAIVSRARTLWSEAVSGRGPWTVSVTIDRGPDGTVSVGEKVTATIRGRNAAGRPQDLTAALTYQQLTGPASVRLGADGLATVTLTAPTAGAASMTARAAGAPAGKLLLIVPSSWQKNPSPGQPSAYSQRGLVATQPAVSIVASAALTVVKNVPTLVTQASAQAVVPGASITDSVTVSGTRGAAGSFTWSLLGPVPALRDGTCPGVGASSWATAPVLATGVVETRGDGVYVTAPYQVRPADVGCLTYVEKAAETPSTTAVTTPPGVPAETVLVYKYTPTLVTQASAQRVVPGATITDRVTVSGTRGAAGLFHWSLLGPLAPNPDGSCPGVGAAGWATAGTLASGSVTTAGDGDYVTAPYKVRPADVGCLTYVEKAVATSTTHQVTTPPGVPAETVLVAEPLALAMPCVTTVVSSQTGLVGSRLSDEIRVGCIAATDALVIRWTLHGPISPRPGVSGKAGCNQIGRERWRTAPVAARGTVSRVGPGSVRTAPFTVRKPGCYTYSETVAGTSTTHATSTPPGIAVETAMITRPGPGPVPSVPTGPFRAAAPAGAGFLRIPTLGAAAPVVAVGVQRGSMGVPSSPQQVGWLRSTAAPGDVIGSAVIAGHVSNRQDRPGVLAKLSRVRRGAIIAWVDPSGASHRYQVTAVQRFPRSRPLPRTVFRTDGEPVLRVVTCTSRVRTAGGGFHYRDNLVVTARALP